MDMRALKIGQKVNVHLFSQVKEATVTKMTEKYVRVEIPPSGPFTKWLPKDGQVWKWEFKDGKLEKWEWGPNDSSWRPVPLIEEELVGSGPEDENGWIINFNYDGGQIESWYGSLGCYPRPIADLKIFLKEEEIL